MKRDLIFSSVRTATFLSHHIAINQHLVSNMCFLTNFLQDPEVREQLVLAYGTCSPEALGPCEGLALFWNVRKQHVLWGQCCRGEPLTSNTGGKRNEPSSPQMHVLMSSYHSFLMNLNCVCPSPTGNAFLVNKLFCL